MKVNFEIKNLSDVDISSFKKILEELIPFVQDRLGYDKPVKVLFISDPENAINVLGKTAHYAPDTHTVTIYVDNRHPKDMLRSVAHELVHHAQNCRGEFDGGCSTEAGYAQTDAHLRDMEREAYEKGNLCFRDFEDQLKTNKKKQTIYINVMKEGLKPKYIKEGFSDSTLCRGNCKSEAEAGAYCGKVGVSLAESGRHKLSRERIREIVKKALQERTQVTCEFGGPNQVIPEATATETASAIGQAAFGGDHTEPDAPYQKICVKGGGFSPLGESLNKGTKIMNKKNKLGLTSLYEGWDKFLQEAGRPHSMRGGRTMADLDREAKMRETDPRSIGLSTKINKEFPDAIVKQQGDELVVVLGDPSDVVALQQDPDMQRWMSDEIGDWAATDDGFVVSLQGGLNESGWGEDEYMDVLEDEFPWLAKSVQSQEIPAEVAVQLAKEYGSEEETEEQMNEWGGRPYDPTVPGDFQRYRDNPTGDAEYPMTAKQERKFQVGDQVRVVDGGLRGATGEIIEPITLVTGESGFVILLDSPADKKVFGQAGDEVPVAADKLAPPMSAINEEDPSNDNEEDTMTTTQVSKRAVLEAVIRKSLIGENIDLEQFPNPLPTNQGGETFLSKGLRDGDKGDDRVEAGPKSLAAAAAKPSQSAIYLGKALGMAMGPMGDGGNLKAIISADGYILDGHHRWAATMFNNPGADVGGTGIEMNMQELIPILRAAGDAYGNDRRGEPSGGDKNIFKATIKDVVATLKVLNKGTEHNSPGDAKKWLDEIGGIDVLEKRLAAIKAKGADVSAAPARAEMPVIDADKGEDQNIATRLKKGAIDIKPPYTELPDDKKKDDSKPIHLENLNEYREDYGKVDTGNPLEDKKQEFNAKWMYYNEEWRHMDPDEEEWWNSALDALSKEIKAMEGGVDQHAHLRTGGLTERRQKRRHNERYGLLMERMLGIQNLSPIGTMESRTNWLFEEEEEEGSDPHAYCPEESYLSAQEAEKEKEKSENSGNWSDSEIDKLAKHSKDSKNG